MTEYAAVYEKRFQRNLRRYASVRRRIKNRIERVLVDPYRNTESLVDASGGLNLAGCRSVYVDLNFRIIFVICEECRGIPNCEFCFCEGLADRTVVFLTVGPHEKAYAMK